MDRLTAFHLRAIERPYPQPDGCQRATSRDALQKALLSTPLASSWCGLPLCKAPFMTLVASHCQDLGDGAGRGGSRFLILTSARYATAHCERKTWISCCETVSASCQCSEGADISWRNDGTEAARSQAQAPEPLAGQVRLGPGVSGRRCRSNVAVTC